MANKRQRIFAGFFAGLFLISSSALAVAVVYTAVTQNDTPKDNQSKALEQLQKQQQASKNKLQGTKLADFTPVASIGQLQQVDLTSGSGTAVKPGATITADYTGAVASTGVVFQSSKDAGQPATFSLSKVIAGWSQGVPGMKVGGTRRLLIPASMAYGDKPPPGSGIPVNADLVFDVTVTKIDKQ